MRPSSSTAPSGIMRSAVSVSYDHNKQLQNLKGSLTCLVVCRLSATMTEATGPRASHRQKLAWTSSNGGSHGAPKTAREDKSHCTSVLQPRLVSQQAKQAV